MHHKASWEGSTITIQYGLLDKITYTCCRCHLCLILWYIYIFKRKIYNIWRCTFYIDPSKKPPILKLVCCVYYFAGGD